MNAVIYARYSSDNQREESIDGQIRECMEYCSRNGMTVIKEYIDRALSAKTDQRPDFQRMIKDSAKGLFDVVVVWKLDRFARNRYDSAHYKAALKKNGVRVISAKENIADGPEGIILESMLEGMAEYYSAELSVKVIRGHTENALKCKYNGGTPTFGFIIDANKQYQPDPVRAPIVLDIFKMYDTGSTMKEIVDHLNGLGVTTVRGKVADLNFISGILHNRKYIGEYKYRDIVVPDGIPALVPTDLFERVQSQMQKNKKAPARHKAEDDYLLTTKLFCGSCKAMMVGESGRSSSKGRVYHYYRCVNSKKKKICTAKHRSVRKEPLERAVVDSVMRNIMDDAFVEYFTDQALALQGQESSELPALRRQLADTEKAIDNLLNAIQAGAFNASVKRRLDEMEETKEKLELSIVKEEMKKPQFTREQIQFYILQFRKVDINTLEGRRRLIDSFVNSVVMYDDSILVTFNYKEGAERITFDQIERSDLSSLGRPSGPAAPVPLHKRYGGGFVLGCRRGDGGGVFGGEVAELDHLAHHVLLALGRKVRVGGQGIDRRGVGDAGQQGGLVGGQLGGLLAKIAGAGVADAVVAVPKIDGVDVQLQDLVLGAGVLQAESHEYLRDLAGEAFFLGEKQIFCHLLGDGAAALVQAAGAQVVDRRPQDGDGVDAAVLRKAVVLHRHHRVQVQRGQLVDGGVVGVGPHGGYGGLHAPGVQGLAVHLVAQGGQQAAAGQSAGQRQAQQPGQDLDNGSHGIPLANADATGGRPPAVFIITRPGRVCLHLQGKHKGKLSFCSKFAKNPARPCPAGRARCLILL